MDSPDIITFGFQEIIDLEDRGLTAKNVLYGGMKRAENPEDARASEKISGAYNRWTDKLVSAVRNAMDPSCPYERTVTEVMVGLYSCTFVKTSERISLTDKSASVVKRGMGGRYGNKVSCTYSEMSLMYSCLKGCCLTSFRSRRFLYLPRQLSFSCWSAPCTSTKCRSCRYLRAVAISHRYHIQRRISIRWWRGWNHGYGS